MGAGAGAVGVVGGIEPLLPLALRHLPELRRITPPERAAGDDEIGRVSGGGDVLRGDARRIESGRGVAVEVEDACGQIGEEVGGVLVDEGALPVHAAVEELRERLYRAAHL